MTELDADRAAPKPVVLVVEDQAAVRTIVDRSLTRAGFTVVATDSPERAVSLLGEASRFDVLVSDLMMPRMNGVQLALKARQLRAQLKILLMSGYDQEFLNDQLAEVENAQVLQKPFRPDELVEKVRSMLATQPGSR